MPGWKTGCELVRSSLDGDSLALVGSHSHSVGNCFVVRVRSSNVTRSLLLILFGEVVHYIVDSLEK
jgi:hypothetical protein